MANTAKKKKVIPLRIILLGILAVLVVVVAAGSLLSGDDETGTAVSNLGNRGGNLSGGGTVIEVGDNLYISEPSSGQILKVGAGDTSGMPVGTLKGRYLNSDGTSLWYQDFNTRKLMKSDLNGTAPVEVVPGMVDKPMLSDGYIYYIDVESNYSLCRISTESGSAPEPFGNTDARIQQYAIFAGHVFFCDLNTGDSLWRMKMDGTVDKHYSQIRIGQVLFTHGDRMYYSAPNENGVLKYLTPDGDGYIAATQVGETASCALADDQAVYYVKAADGCLYKYDLSTGTQTQMTSEPVYGIQDAGRYIYAQSITDGGAFTVIAKN